MIDQFSVAFSTTWMWNINVDAFTLFVTSTYDNILFFYVLFRMSEKWKRSFVCKEQRLKALEQLDKESMLSVTTNLRVGKSTVHSAKTENCLKIFEPKLKGIKQWHIVAFYKNLEKIGRWCYLVVVILECTQRTQISGRSWKKKYKSCILNFKEESFWPMKDGIQAKKPDNELIS